jgi:hypothetical protein
LIELTVTIAGDRSLLLKNGIDARQTRANPDEIQLQQMEPDLVADLLERTVRQVSPGDVHHSVEPSEDVSRLRNRLIDRQPVSNVDDQGDMWTGTVG